MTWIESHVDLGEHPKTIRCARLLAISEPAMVGHLHYLWWWSIQYTRNGDLSGCDAVDIARAARWAGPAEDLVTALLTCGLGDQKGFLDRTVQGGLSLHDWEDYAGRLVERREADAARKRESRARERPPDVRSPSAGRPADGLRTSGVTVPYPTVPNHGEKPPTGAQRSAATAARPVRSSGPPIASDDEAGAARLLRAWYAELGKRLPGGKQLARDTAAAAELLAQAGDEAEALAYLRYRRERGQSPALPFAARDYAPGWREREKRQDDATPTPVTRAGTEQPAWVAALEPPEWRETVTALAETTAAHWLRDAHAIVQNGVLLVRAPPIVASYLEQRLQQQLAFAAGMPVEIESEGEETWQKANS